MGTFNILKTEIACANCNCSFEVKIQFKYGDTWQHPLKLEITLSGVEMI